MEYQDEHEREIVETNLKELFESTNQINSEPQLESHPFYSQLEPEQPRYQDEVQIGKGGLKVISRVYDPKIKKHVALARLHEGSPEENYEPFLREGYLTAQLDHPNIIKIFDIGLDEKGAPYYVMELKTGSSLFELVKSSFSRTAPKSQQWNSFIEIFLKICDAVDYAHSKGILHLDLKPENIQVGEHGEVIVCDWGMGKVLGDEKISKEGIEFINADMLNHMTLNGTIKGTPEYMAPEQFTGDDRSITTDIYALGNLLCFLLLGKTLCSGQSLKEISQKKVQGFKESDFIHLKQSVPVSLYSIIVKALNHNQGLRYGNVRELKNEIQNFIAGYSTHAENASFIREIKLLYFRYKSQINIVLCSILVVVSTVTMFIISLKESEQKIKLSRDALEIERQERVRVGQEAAPNYYAKAEEFLSNHLIDDAQYVLEIATLLDSEHMESKNLLAALYFLKGDYQKASTTFSTQMTALDAKIQLLNQMYLQGEYSEKEELYQTNELLRYCSPQNAPVLSTLLYLHWLSDERQTYQYLAMKYFYPSLNESRHILSFLKEMKDHDLKRLILEKVIDNLLKNKTWIERRIPISMALSMSVDEDLNQQLREILPTNLALGQKVKASLESINDPKGVVDGTIHGNDSWNANPCPAHVIIDLGGVHEVSKLVINIRSHNYRSFDPKKYFYKYEVQSSLDGIQFKSIKESSIRSIPRFEDEHEVTPTHSRFIKFLVDSNDGDFWLHIREIEVY